MELLTVIPGSTGDLFFLISYQGGNAPECQDATSSPLLNASVLQRNGTYSCRQCTHHDSGLPDPAGHSPVGVRGILVGTGLSGCIPDDVPSCMELHEAFHEVRRHMQLHLAKEQEEDQGSAQASLQHLLSP